MDRSEISRCIAKYLAYIACGKMEAASEWAQRLVDILRDAGVTIR